MYEDYFKEDKYEDRKDDCRKERKEEKCKPDCKEILKKYHELIADADELFKASNNIVDKEVAGEICDALKALAKAFKLDEKADEKVKRADMLLDKTGCDKKFDKKICKCKDILCKANEAYDKENAYLCKAGDLLEEALKAIEKSIKFRKMGNEAYNDYVKCIHHKEEKKEDKKDCKCPNPIERYYQ